MSRYDKYDPVSGGFRALLAADWLEANLNEVVAVSLDANGRVVVGTAGQSGFVGVVVLSKLRNAGDVVDVMTDGEIVEFANADGTDAAAGTEYTSNADGTYGVTVPGAANFVIGHTVEATRLVVRVGR